METGTKPMPALPAVTLGLTFLLMALTFGLPVQVVPLSKLHEIFPNYSPETGNAFAFVAWAGWAHFLFAYRGQLQAITKPNDAFKSQKLGLFVLSFVLVVLVLFSMRLILGMALFSGLVWIHFIDHFVKSERVFEGNKAEIDSFLRRWGELYQPLVAFSWLTLVLNNVWNVINYPWVLWGISIALGAIFLLCGAWRRLVEREIRGPILALFFVAEAVVWGSVGRVGGPSFLAGVYVFHVAAASYFHYLGSYFFAGQAVGSRPPVIKLWPVVIVNILTILLGSMVVNTQGLSILKPIFGLEWFTVWVGAHLIMSDVFQKIKSWNGFRRAAC